MKMYTIEFMTRKKKPYKPRTFNWSLYSWRVACREKTYYENAGLNVRILPVEIPDKEATEP